jgi:hypothetical protein
LERLQAAKTALEMHAEACFPHGTKQQVFKFWSHAQSRSPPSLSHGPRRYKEKMATPEQKAVFALHFAKHLHDFNDQGV